ncbi:MAG: tetratricopeptide repeat protein [Acetivibrionales bacterium]
MSNTYKHIILGLAVPAIIIIIAWKISIWLGVAVFLIYLAGLAYYNRALIFSMIGSRNYMLGKTAEALKWFKKAHETKRTGAGTRISVSYAYILLKNGDLSASDDILQQVMNSSPAVEDVPYIKSILALVLWKKGELDNAVEMLEEVIKTYKTTSVYGSLGYLLILKGDLEKALKFNLEAYDYNSSDKIIQDNLAQNYYLLGMYDKAEEIYKPLLESGPSFPEPYYNYGLLLEKVGKAAQALEYMKKAMNYKFTYLSSITREEVESKIREIESRL